MDILMVAKFHKSSGGHWKIILIVEAKELLMHLKKHKAVEMIISLFVYNIQDFQV